MSALLLPHQPCVRVLNLYDGQAKEIESVKALALDQARNAGKFSALYDQRGDQLTAANNRIKELEEAVKDALVDLGMTNWDLDYKDHCKQVLEKALTSTANEKREE